MPIAVRRAMTLEEYLHYDDGTDTRHELVEGILVEMPPESRLKRIASFLFGTFLKFGIPTDLLTIGVQIATSSPTATARQPDFVVLSITCAHALENASSSLISHEMPPPALVVEIVSPGSENHDRDYLTKHREYAARGIPEYWIIDPDAKLVTVCTLINNAYHNTPFQADQPIVSPAFPALNLAATQLLQAGRSSQPDP